MSTLVCFHAHPDDEAISTGGLMAKAAAAGHRVVLVCATRGEQGEPQPDVLEHGEQLWQRRVVETADACKILGAEEPRWLGYEDSGMIGEPTNDNPASFWQCDESEAVSRLVSVLEEVHADVLTIYDDHGGYGHPDHIRVHTVGLAAARQIELINVFEATINRDNVRHLMEAAEAEAMANGEEPEASEIDRESFGTPEIDISYRVDVSAQVTYKREAMRAHRSQIGPDGFMLQMPDEVFDMAFGSEWFNVPGVSNTGGPSDVELLPGL